MTSLHKLQTLGQSIWLDYMSLTFTKAGDLQNLIEQGVRGVASNPTAFEETLIASNDYDEALKEHLNKSKAIEDLYEMVAVADVQQAANVLHPIYEESKTQDGYINLDLDPALAHDTQDTISNIKRLFGAVARPNLMIKIPATPAGIPAIQAAVAAGINVNTSLIFSLSQYEAVVEAYISGLEKLAETGVYISKVASVASCCISPIDNLVDAKLAVLGETELQGNIGIDNAKLIYARFQDLFKGPRWEALANLGAQIQRPLWVNAKNPAYADTHYIDPLIGPYTVSSLPLPA